MRRRRRDPGRPALSRAGEAGPGRLSCRPAGGGGARKPAHPGRGAGTDVGAQSEAVPSQARGGFQLPGLDRRARGRGAFGLRHGGLPRRQGKGAAAAEPLVQAFSAAPGPRGHRRPRPLPCGVAGKRCDSASIRDPRPVRFRSLAQAGHGGSAGGGRRGGEPICARARTGVARDRIAGDDPRPPLDRARQAL